MSKLIISTVEAYGLNYSKTGDVGRWYFDWRTLTTSFFVFTSFLVIIRSLPLSCLVTQRKKHIRFPWSKIRTKTFYIWSSVYQWYNVGCCQWFIDIMSYASAVCFHWSHKFIKCARLQRISLALTPHSCAGGQQWEKQSDFLSSINTRRSQSWGTLRCLGSSSQPLLSEGRTADLGVLSGSSSGVSKPPPPWYHRWYEFHIFGRWRH